MFCTKELGLDHVIEIGRPPLRRGSTWAFLHLESSLGKWFGKEECEIEG